MMDQRQLVKTVVEGILIKQGTQLFADQEGILSALETDGETIPALIDDDTPEILF